MSNFRSELNLAKRIVDLTKKRIFNSKTQNNIILSSDFKDIKNKADREAHQFIHNELSQSGIKILSEEDENPEDIDQNKGLIWIIDPLDGTLNFSRGFPMAAISVALWRDMKPILGVVQNIFSDVCYYSLLKEGSWRNDKRIYVSDIKEKQNAVVATGFSSGRKYDNKSLSNFVEDIIKYKKVRMLGCASLMLTHVANGDFDIYKEDDIFIWDVAAGLSLVSEAGGTYSIVKGKKRNQYNVEAKNLVL